MGLQPPSFTSPASDDLDPKTATSKGYDLVLNGYEGGWREHPDPPARGAGAGLRGARAHRGRDRREVRPSDPRVPLRGRPGGIAMGLDRIVMLMAGKETLREITASPRRSPAPTPDRGTGSG